MTAASENLTIQKFFQSWSESFTSVLNELGVTTVKASFSETESIPGPTEEVMAKGICAGFSGGGILTGAMLWMAEPSSAVQLAQLLLSEPPDPAVEFTEAHRNAFSELMRQIAGHTATSWKAETDSETQLTFHATTIPDAEPGQSTMLLLSGDKLSSVSLRLFLSAHLCEALISRKPKLSEVIAPVIPPVIEPIVEPIIAPPPQVVPFELEKQPNSKPGNNTPASAPSNLDLLLDVELDATIRFGDRSMLLRDVFSLMPGAVVELNQQVNESAELLVAGRLIARGEVVIVDGNFGLRITNVISPVQRVELLRI
jgi:flagellar motor switch protein FliN/FliY